MRKPRCADGAQAIGRKILITFDFLCHRHYAIFVSIQIEVDDMSKNNIKRDPNRKPVHPGHLLRECALPHLQMSQKVLADKLNLSRYMISQILSERVSINAEISLGLEIHVGSTAEQWMRMQIAHDVWIARRSTNHIRSAMR